MTRDELIKRLTAEGYLKTPEIIGAFRAIDRARFAGEENMNLAYEDTALPIGYGATISQPAVVAFMFEKLQPRAGNKILDIGSGSGWTSAMLAEVIRNQKTANSGHVIAIEIVPELVERARATVAKHYPKLAERITFVAGNALGGYPSGAPFDRIIAAASLADEIPDAWKKQLAVGGRIAAPVGNTIRLVVKTGKNNYKEEVSPGFIFVPFQYDGA
ncbi:MAG: hypothetical protein A3H71_02445 [Candidatus Sungbacteria bacterium RIFCSPLOWO2_02_FULL_48_13b]|uniref:Protein-L-isoaspartate O-methyltransferase n=2 Tax=Candidatus Sungiibacteriota TaxID=1817917 RepID=A0A1G2LH61_9BACT|nr:MAG: hypothetical protein A3C12_00130 [Candidatus Sungbacteria bacterium RIFCSPHIGHO2_02_FULL_49_20]OHA10162.1 MAG: hypothetical protein A3H71_02445 [Candidatus Sungbacteria bacterium RIFCSPLOWO2_02_FULL_48_13b]